MNTEKLVALERYLTHLVQAFVRLKEDNTHLSHTLAQLQQTVHEQQHALEHWQAAQAELARLRTATQTLQREREIIRARLAEMLIVLERLEQRAHVPNNSQV